MSLCCLSDSVGYAPFEGNAEVALYPFHLSCDKTKPSSKGQPVVDISAMEQPFACMLVPFHLAHNLILGMTHFTIYDTDDPISILGLSKSD